VQRIVQGRSSTLTKRLYIGSTATNPAPDSATAVVTRLSDGTSFSPQVTDAGTGVFQLTLTPAQTATLDTLSVVWTATFIGETQTYVDQVQVVSDTWFTLAEFRSLEPQFQNTTDYSDGKISELRTRVESRLESCLGYALVHRYSKETRTPYGGVLRTRWPYINLIRSISVQGTALTTDELANVTTDGTQVYRAANVDWLPNAGSILIGYEHGLDELDEDAKWSALMLAKQWAVRGPIDDRAATFSSVEGGTYGLVVPGRGGSWVGNPDVDAWIDQRRLRTVG